ncbi:TPA: hypothetical protein ACH3X2_013343 [Trebouxia sp. C0005]
MHLCEHLSEFQAVKENCAALPLQDCTARLTSAMSNKLNLSLSRKPLCPTSPQLTTKMHSQRGTPRFQPSLRYPFDTNVEALCLQLHQGTKMCDASFMQLNHFCCDQTDCRGHGSDAQLHYKSREESMEAHLQSSCRCSHAWVSHMTSVAGNKKRVCQNA